MGKSQDQKGKGEREKRKRGGKKQIQIPSVFHTFAVYDNFRTVTVRSHEYCFVVYLLRGPFRFAINDFEKLQAVSPHKVPNAYSHFQCGKCTIEHTVLVMPSVNRTNSIWLPGPSQSGFRVKASLRAEACESAWL